MPSRGRKSPPTFEREGKGKEEMEAIGREALKLAKPPRASHSPNSNDRRRPYSQTLKDSGIAAKIGVSIGGIEMLLPAMLLIENDFYLLRTVSPTAEEVLPLVGRWEKEIGLVLRAFRRHALEARVRDIYPMFTLALLTFKYQPEKAAEFWYRVWRQDGTMLDSPEREMSQFVTKMRLIDVPEDYYVRRMGEYWNAWWQGRAAGRVIDHDKPARFDGTPYTGAFSEADRAKGLRPPLKRGPQSSGVPPSRQVVGWRKRNGGSRG